MVTDVSRKKYPGVAAQSKSVFCAKEPRNTKFIFAVILDRVLDVLTEKYAQVVAVQVGANDGVSGDPISRHAVQHQWKCLLIEPLDSAADKLEQTYKSNPNATIERVAIWTEDGTSTFYEVVGAEVISSFSMETIMLHELKYDDLPGMIQEKDVPTRRLDSLCADRGFLTPHILAIDAEGCDDIALSTFDLAGHQPDAILLEHVALSEKASKDLRARLENLGYRLLFDRHDLLALRCEGFAPEDLAFYQDLMYAARHN